MTPGAPPPVGHRTARRTLEPWPRTWLFTPADQQRMLDSALRSGAQALIADLEDAVAPAHKDLAREQALRFLEAKKRGPQRFVRINDPRTEHGRLDLEALSAHPPLAVMVPKASVASIELVRDAGIARMIALVETARGVAEIERIAALDGVVAVAIGTVDLAAELGLGELPGGLELLHVRSRLVLACALVGIPPIDGVHLDLANRVGLQDETRRARALGFAAKLCIHPSQLQTVLAAFAPSADELERARRIVETYEHTLAEQRGTTLAGSEMVDLATVRRAERVLASADEARPR